MYKKLSDRDLFERIAHMVYEIEERKDVSLPQGLTKELIEGFKKQKIVCCEPTVNPVVPKFDNDMAPNPSPS